MSDLIVDPKPGVFTFVGKDGDDLRDIVMTLNDQWSFYMVRRVGDDAQLKGLEKTLEDVKENGVDRNTMVTMESLGLGPLQDNFPAGSYTLRRSKTNYKVALEEAGSRIKSTLSSIYKFIIESITKGLEFLKEKVSKAKQAMKRKTASDLVDFYDIGYDASAFLTAAEINADPKLSSEAEALSDSYSELLEMLVNNATFTTTFNELVKGIDDFTNPLLKKIELVNKAIKEIEKHDTVSADRTLMSVKQEEPPRAFKRFSNLLVPGASGETSAIVRSMNQKISELKNSPANIKVTEFNRLRIYSEMARKKISGNDAMFIFDETSLETVLNKAIRGVNDFRIIESRITQSLGEEDFATAKSLRSALDVVYSEIGVITFILTYADIFFNELGRFFRNSALFMKHCTKEQ